MNTPKSRQSLAPLPRKKQVLAVKTADKPQAKKLPRRQLPQRAFPDIPGQMP